MIPYLPPDFFMSAAAVLRSQIESYLESRIPSALSIREKQRPSVLPFGIGEIDAALQGVPRGCLSEITGPVSSGTTSLLLALAASATRHGECCALVDAGNAFDPASAQAQGVELARLLWVRCAAGSELNAIAQALKAAEMLLETGGFGLVAMDMAGFSPRAVRRIPLATWFRFRRAVENTATALVALSEEPTAANSPALVLRLKRKVARWQQSAKNEAASSHTWLLSGMEVEVEVVRAQHLRKSAVSASIDCRVLSRW